MKFLAVGQFFKAAPVLSTARRCQALTDRSEIEARGGGYRGSRLGCRVSGVGLHQLNSGVPECWSFGVIDSENVSFHHSTNPILHHSILLPMTNRAARETFDLVLLHKLLAKCNLVRRWLPIHAEDLFTRAHKALRIAMAF